MRLTNRAAERFQRALEGERVTDADLVGLLQTSRALSSVPLAGAAPREEFVLALRERLMAEAEQLPSPSPAAAKAAAGRRAAARSAPVVVVVGRGFPRVLAGAAASVVAVGAIVGVASRSAVPGSALYPVKGWLDSVAVQMAGSDYDRGLTHLSQAQEHISDARALAEQSNVDPQEFVDVLRSAVSSVRSGQRDLNTSFDATGNPQALLAIRDFSARALPQVEALRPEVPAKALPVLGELQALLADAESASLRRLAACAPTCATLHRGIGEPDRPADPARRCPLRRRHDLGREWWRRSPGSRHGGDRSTRWWGTWRDGGLRWPDPRWQQRRRHALHRRDHPQRPLRGSLRPGPAEPQRHPALGGHRHHQHRGDPPGGHAGHPPAARSGVSVPLSPLPCAG